MIRGRLTPEAGTLLVQALDAARETLYQRTRRAAETSPDDSATAAPTRAQQHADALVMLAETALHQVLDPGAPGERYQVVVHVDAAVLEDPVQEGQTALEGAQQARIHPRTACARWLGERLDLDWAIDVLHPQATETTPPVEAVRALPAHELPE